MIQTGRVVGRSITTNKDGTNDVMMLEVQISDPDDIQSVQFFSPPGDDSPPSDGSIVAIIDISDAYKIAVAADDNIAPSMDEGEKKLYSSDSGAIQAFINLLKGGNIELNGNNDNAVAFQDLKDGFDTFVTDFNTFIGVFNAHVHSSSGTGPPTTSGTITTASVDASKIDTIKVP